MSIYHFFEMTIFLANFKQDSRKNCGRIFRPHDMEGLFGLSLMCDVKINKEINTYFRWHTSKAYLVGVFFCFIFFWYQLNTLSHVAPVPSVSGPFSAGGAGVAVAESRAIGITRPPPPPSTPPRPPFLHHPSSAIITFGLTTHLLFTFAAVIEGG